MTVSIAASHRDRLGCSELAAAIGVNPFKTAYRLWEEKTGRVEPEDLSNNLRVTLGNHLEDVVARLWTARTGLKLRRRNQPFYRDEWLVGHLDREIVGKKEIWEGKTALGMFRSDEWGEDGSDQVPLHYIVQCLGYLAVTGAERCHLAALLAGPELRHYVIDRDDDAIQQVISQAQKFWGHVLNNEPPAITNLADAQRRWPQSTGQDVTAYADDIRRVAEWRELARIIKDAEDRLDLIKLRMAERLQEADTLTDPTGAQLVTWKTQTTTRLDSKLLKAEEPELWQTYSTQTISRVFRLAKETKK